MTAIISPNGQYRYTLTRPISQAVRWVRPMLFIMLNPSTADATLDDPTIRRCRWFASREGCTKLTVVNLFAYRATDPGKLITAADPIGPDNLYHLGQQIEAHKLGIVVAAWGSHPAKSRFHLNDYFLDRGPIWCLGKTKNGDPKHPLYLKKDTPLEIFVREPL